MAEAKNERLWFKTNMKLANLWVSLRESAKAAKVRLGRLAGWAWGWGRRLLGQEAVGRGGVRRAMAGG